jgi:hypothetical protein
MRTCRSFDSDKVAPDSMTLIHDTWRSYLITVWQHHRIDIRRLTNRPLKHSPLRNRPPSFMKKSQQRLVISDVLFKGWSRAKSKRNWQSHFCRFPLATSGLTFAHLFQHKKHFLPAWTMNWQTALKLRAVPWTFLGKDSVRQYTDHDNAV